ncbi:longitudinals lacking protein, isoforms A/B/D/L-like [Nasonia vitripennis]|uniref:C2H2-type domain-containing protein n=1 Tax=Nasonia vitripennis TaxID=7425 RepID=A0A7M7QGQ8_NASVI|nr:longitudinals lacking protein, isoforms A/B/D/L-like [Nasonia vitripennis]
MTSLQDAANTPFSFSGYYISNYDISLLPGQRWEGIQSHDVAAAQGFANTCHQCGKSYKHTYHLKRHLKYECGQHRRFCCCYCSHRAKHKDHIQKHIANKHRNKPIKYSVDE